MIHAGVPSFGLPLAVPSLIAGASSLPDSHFHRSCDQCYDSPRGFDGRRHRSSDSFDAMNFSNSERLTSNSCSADALADGLKNANDLAQSYGILPAATA